jgi:hypothetical protein
MQLWKSRGVEQQRRGPSAGAPRLSPQEYALMQASHPIHPLPQMTQLCLESAMYEVVNAFATSSLLYAQWDSIAKAVIFHGYMLLCGRSFVCDRVRVADMVAVYPAETFLFPIFTIHIRLCLPFRLCTASTLIMSPPVLLRNAVFFSELRR